MDLELLRQIGERLLALDGGQCHLRLEGRCMVPARSSAHHLSCSTAIPGSCQAEIPLIGLSRFSRPPLPLCRRVLAWRLSITMEVGFCIEALEEALARHGRPDIFNTDQGSQFTSADFTGILVGNGITISMDGKGAWRDNVFVERVWRSVKYEEVYLRAYDTVSEARASIGRYF